VGQILGDRDTSGTVVEYNGTRLATSPGGARAAGRAAGDRCWVERPDGEIVNRSGQVDFPIEAGDVVGVDTPGGGGYGG
jgi:5-oxoprolinase (ATP-hydrolysing)